MIRSWPHDFGLAWIWQALGISAVQFILLMPTAAHAATPTIAAGTATAMVVEFYNTDLDNYFITADASEAAAIDSGSAGPGWKRTGETFGASGSTSVCRFYGSQSPGPNSHFYTADAGECAYLKQLQASTPATEKRWNYEGIAFSATLPTNDTCPSGTVPVYRAYNNGSSRGVGSNHRITANLTTAIQQVVTHGWNSEGVVMCASSANSPTANAAPAVTAFVTSSTSTSLTETSYFRNAKVCIDANNNGVCDAGEPAMVTDSAGQYTLPGAGSAVVLEIGTDAIQYDPDTGTSAPVASRIVLRAPREAPSVVSVESTAVVAEMESHALSFNDAVQKVANSLGVSAGKLLGDFTKEGDLAAKNILKSASAEGLTRIQLALASAKPTDDIRKILAGATGTLDKIRNVVVIYLENRSFDNLYGLFPGANGIANAIASPSGYRQLDRDGLTVLPALPPVWNASTDPTWSFVSGLPNKPFRIDAAPGGAPGKDPSVSTPDFVHRFYQNQMQINGGRINMFATWSNAGGLTMGYYDGSPMRLWTLAQQYTLADNYFQGAFGGSFLNHFWLVCACTPIWPNPPAANIASVDASGTRLTLASNSPASALGGKPAYVADGSVTPKLADGKHYAINTAQPPYQPSNTPPPVGGDPRLADPNGGSGEVPLPAQTLRTIGDTLTTKNVNWRWYAGGWQKALADGAAVAFEAHHHPFNYFRRFDPTTASGAAERAEHLRDYTDLLDDIQNGSLPPVTFYKPEGSLCQHPGSGDFDKADAHVADLVAKLQASPQWKNMLVVVTYDENGGLWDHVAPPKADMWGPGTRVPAIIISPYGKKGYVDSVPYDTTSIIKFLTRRFGLDPLPGARKNVGDLSNALDMIR